MAKILAVDDEPVILGIVKDSLAPTPHEVFTASDGASALRIIEQREPDLIVLDLNLGGDIDGLTICRHVREQEDTRGILIIVLTGMIDQELELRLFDAGADDFVQKQRFRANLFRRRIEAVLRRGLRPAAASRLEIGPLALDPGRREVTLDGRSVRLTPTEFAILQTLGSRDGQVVTRQELLDRGSDVADPATSRAIDMHIKQIRRKLGPHAAMIGTVYGKGYRLSGVSVVEEPDD